MSFVDHSIYLFLHTAIFSFLKRFIKCGWMLDNIFPKFSFSNKLWFCPDIFSRFLFGQPLPIFVVLNFLRVSRFQKCLLLFYPRLNAFLIPSSAKAPGWKISRRLSILRIKSRSTMIVKDWPNKNLTRFLFGTKFQFIFERKNKTFWSHIQWREQPVGKNGNRTSLIDRSRW